MRSDRPDCSPLLRWIQDHLDYPHDYCCLIWPFGKRQGYGFLVCDGKAQSAHRYICELAHGPAPEGYVAAHSCNRGYDACVNPKHLSWKTKSENQRDRADRQGKGHPHTKLTPDAVAQIRAVATLEPREVTAKRFGVTIVTIKHVQTGKTWRGDRRRSSHLTAEQVLKIRTLKGTKTQKAIADEFGVKHSVVHRILAGKAYGFVTDSDCA